MTRHPERRSNGVTPDLLCVGKGISSGAFPLGAMIAREDMANAFYGPVQEEVQLAHGHTFAGNPLASAVGIAVMDEILEQKLDKKARRLGKYFAQTIEGLTQFGVVREIRSKGALLGVELVESVDAMKPFPGTALKNGLIMRIDPDWFALAQP